MENPTYYNYKKRKGALYNLGEQNTKISGCFLQNKKTIVLLAILLQVPIFLWFLSLSSSSSSWLGLRHQRRWSGGVAALGADVAAGGGARRAAPPAMRWSGGGLIPPEWFLGWECGAHERSKLRRRRRRRCRRGWAVGVPALEREQCERQCPASSLLLYLHLSLSLSLSSPRFLGVCVDLCVSWGGALELTFFFLLGTRILLSYGSARIILLSLYCW